jgi:hypothetical protein
MAPSWAHRSSLPGQCFFPAGGPVRRRKLLTPSFFASARRKKRELRLTAFKSAAPTSSRLSKFREETISQSRTSQRKESIPFAGHIPSEITATEASNAGQKSVEHIIYSSLAFDCSAQADELGKKKREAASKRDEQAVADITDEANRTFSAEKAAALWQTFKKNGTWVTPTLFSIWVNAHQLEMSPDDPQLAYLPASLRKQWAPAKNPTKDVRDTEAWWQRQFENDRKLTGEMNRAGVRLLAGSDSLDRYDFAGTSLHRELQMLVSAGLTPLEALQTATLNPTEFLVLAKSGRISPGYLADLVLLDGDPTADIANTIKVAAVVLHGRFLSREELDAMLAKARAAAAAIPSASGDAK